MFFMFTLRRLTHVYMDENWPLFQPMKMVSISANENNEIPGGYKEFQRTFFQSQRVERIGVQ